MEITSNSGTYNVFFDPFEIESIYKIITKDDFIVLDKNIADIYKDDLRILLGYKNTYLLDANENNKSFNSLAAIYEFLISNNVRKKSRLFAIGGGITQDVSCFIASTIYRGIDWFFVPTTLLSQCDSCIGSESSINIGAYKNLIGNFYPPKKIYILTDFLRTLDKREIQSGIGEIFKVSVIDGIDSFKRIANDYDLLGSDKQMLSEYIKYSLNVKKQYIQIDEFDKNIRNIFNYGHSFGHALESTSSFAIPHGIAVTMGMDIANYLSKEMGYIDSQLLMMMHQTLRKNYDSYLDLIPSVLAMIEALKTDKKNTFSTFTFILLNEQLKLNKVEMVSDDNFKVKLKSALEFIAHE